MIARSIRFTGLAMLALLATACNAAVNVASPPSTASMDKSPVSSAKPSLKPVWPDNGIAQRTIPGVFSSMFVENDHGRLHVWVLYGGTIDDMAHVEALDFFTGKRMPVTETLDDDTKQPLPEFTDAQGNYHLAPSQVFEPSRDLPETLSHSLETIAGYAPDASQIVCSGSFWPIDGGIMHYGAAPKWSKIAVYRGRPRACKHGDYTDVVGSTLDLGDGTFLIESGCHVFRLRISNLEPAGAAPGIRIVDAADMRKAMQVVRARHLKDPTQYLDETLHLNIDDANSCQ